MVRAGRYSGDLCSVFSRAQPAARARAEHDAGSRRRDARVVYEIDAARGRARLQLRLQIAAPAEMAADFRSHLARRDTDDLPAAAVQSQLCRASRGLVRAG